MNGRKWIIGGLIGAATLSLTGRVSAQAPGPASNGVVPATAVSTAPGAAVAAVVNGESIMMAELENVLKLGGPMAVQVSEDRRKQELRQALAILIDEKLQQQFLMKQVAAKAIPAPSDKEVNDKIREMEEGLRKSGGDLQTFCRDKRSTEAEVRRGVGFMMLWHSYALSAVSDKNVEDYYKENKDFFDGVAVKASHIVLRVSPTAPKAEVDAARAKLTELKAEIEGGKVDFAEAAKKYSQCPSAPGGGDIGFFPRKFVVEEEFARVAFGLKVGEVSDVVQTDYGLHLIKVTDRQPGKQPSEFAKIKEEVRAFCTEELHQSVLAKLRSEVKLEVVAAELK